MRGRKVQVTIQAPGERIRDAEGRWTALGHPTTVWGVVAAAASGYSSRTTPDRTKDAGIILLPTGTRVDTEQLVQVAGGTTMPDGTYRVEHVTPTAKHLRCLVQRHRAGGS